jgi:AAA15 family ATPase/GTPase
MLIEFSLSNFRSFRERQTISMVAAPRLRKTECLLKPDLDGESFPNLLKVAAIYGPNASGKSGLMMGINVLQSMVNRPPQVGEQVLPAMPFRFDKNLSNEPSRFEVHFIAKKCRYQFNLALTKERIIEERLVAYPSGEETLYYDRTYINGIDFYRFGPKLEGGETVHDAWKMLTAPQALFLTQAVANSNEELNQLRIPMKWLQRDFSVLDDDEMDRWGQLVQTVGITSPKIGENVSKYLQELDVPVTEIKFKNENDDDFKIEYDSGLTEKQRKIVESVRRPKKTTLTHTTKLGAAEFDLSEESKGTRNLIGFYMPWAMSDDHVVLVDEFDSSLHPEIVVALVRKFLEKDGKGQLIFTTHDTHIMDSKLLRRDQIWLTERTNSGATRIRSVYDFAGRETEDVEKRYFEGYYRSLPKINGESSEIKKVKREKKVNLESN